MTALPDDLVAFLKAPNPCFVATIEPGRRTGDRVIVRIAVDRIVHPPLNPTPRVARIGTPSCPDSVR